MLRVPQTWVAFWGFFAFSVCVWATVDRYLWTVLQHGEAERGDERPQFGRRRGVRRGVGQWVLAWVGREVLAFPIWGWAVGGGVSVVWRGRRFWVGVDMKVHEIGGRWDGEIGREKLG